MAGDGERKVAFITGTTGQDGSYLVELLLSKGKSFPPISRPRRPLFPRTAPSARDRARGGGLTFVWKMFAPIPPPWSPPPRRASRASRARVHRTDSSSRFTTSQATSFTASSAAPPPTTTPASSTSWKKRACGVTDRPSSRPTRVCPRPQIAPIGIFSPDAPRSAPARRRGSRRAPPVFPSYSV